MNSSFFLVPQSAKTEPFKIVPADEFDKLVRRKKTRVLVYSENGGGNSFR